MIYPCLPFLLLGASQELVIPHVKVTYTGIEVADARVLAEVLAAARQVYLDDFAFDMPETVQLDVKAGAGQKPNLYTDGSSGVYLSLTSRKQLFARPSESGVHNLYGMCHELGHVAMYRILQPFDWMSGEAAEAWAHYAGSVVVDRVYELKGQALWPEPWDYREDGLARLQQALARNRDQIAGKWLELEAIVGRKGFREIFAGWARTPIDPMHRSQSLAAALEGERVQAWWVAASPLLLRPLQLSPISPSEISPTALSGKPLILALDDGTMDGKYSRMVDAHGRKFSAPEPDGWYLRAVSVYAERSGGENPPDRKFDIALCDSDMRPIAIWQQPYAAFAKREMGWVRLEIPPTRVPQVFYVAL